MEKPGQDSLKVPSLRFVQYQDLSQPSYFCKACKYYRTRGGTLRNAPVGGGCRKNKRVRQAAPPGNSGDVVSAAAANPPLKPNVQPEIDLSSPNNPSFYNNPLELNFPFPRFRSTRVFDYHHQNNIGVGLGFSSGISNYDNGLQDFISTTNNSSSSPGH